MPNGAVDRKGCWLGLGVLGLAIVAAWAVAIMGFIALWRAISLYGP